MTTARPPRRPKTASYTNIDYRLRPGKHVERQMIVEALSRQRFHDIRNYRYVGMGSIYFTDFKLLFRSLGITSMISIEKEEGDRARFDWNKPYEQVQMLYGETGVHLPGIDWSPPSFVWLDYDGQLSESKLDDLDYVVREAAPGSMILVSINGEKPAPEGMSREDRDADPIAALRLMIGTARTPTNLDPSNLRGAQAIKVYYRLIRDAIEASIARANAVISPVSAKRKWKQVLNFQYKDGASMLTVGGVVYEEGQEHLYSASNFDVLSFFRSGDEPFRINVPRLTMKEMSHLERSTALDHSTCTELPWLDNDERRRYLELYRYLPNFVAAEI